MAPVEPKPYRRTLTSEESDRLWLVLKDRWGVRGGFWYPVTGDEPPHALTFDANGFDDEFGARRLQKVLVDLGVTRVYELNEFSGEPEFEIDLELLTAEYGISGESYWTSEGQEWLIYASHASSITIAGERLVAALKSEWPDWASFEYS